MNLTPTRCMKVAQDARKALEPFTATPAAIHWLLTCDFVERQAERFLEASPRTVEARTAAFDMRASAQSLQKLILDNPHRSH